MIEREFVGVPRVKVGATRCEPSSRRDQKRPVLPSFGQLNQLIERLDEPISTAVWLVAVSCIRPEELAFQWKDRDAGNRS
jgi:hypothetical protein